MRPFARARRGYTLFELIVCTALYSVFLGMAYDVYLEASRLHAACTHYQLGTREAQVWLETVRRDVRTSRGTAPLPSGHSTDGTALALRRPDGAVILHRLDGGRAVREVRRDGETVESTILVRRVESVSFQAPLRLDRPSLVRFALRLERRNEQGRIDPVFDGLAAFRGGAR